MKCVLPIFCMLVLALPVQAQTTAEEFNDRAFAKAISGDIDSGIEDASMAIQLKPGFHKAYNQRANLKLGKNDLDGALADYGKAIEWGPKVAGYYGNRASVREKKQDVAGALADHDKAVALAPKNHHAFYDRGKFKLRNKDYAGAILDFDQTLAINPHYFAVRKVRAEAYRAQGKTKLAEEDEKIHKDESKKFFDKLNL